MRILAISGSLRARSSNGALLEAARRLAPPGIDVFITDAPRTLPHFNPDDDTDPLPSAVVAWRTEVAAADAVLICSPEYARGVPGSLKNALDWLVSGFEIIGKPIGSINASPVATTGQGALLATLRTIGVVIDDATINLPLTPEQRTSDAIAADPELSGELRRVLRELHAAAKPSREVRPATTGRAAIDGHGSRSKGG
jgi:NAD(P)H-dependent FMN reductase